MKRWQGTCVSPYRGFTGQHSHGDGKYPVRRFSFRAMDELGAGLE
jgi:hypothetical protein